MSINVHFFLCVILFCSYSCIYILLILFQFILLYVVLFYSVLSLSNLHFSRTHIFSSFLSPFHLADEKWAQEILLGPSRDDIIPNIDHLLSVNAKKNFTSPSTAASTKFEFDKKDENSVNIKDADDEEEKAFIEDSMRKDIAASKNKKWGNNDVNQGTFDRKTLSDVIDDVENNEVKSLNDQLDALKPQSSPGFFSGTQLFFVF